MVLRAAKHILQELGTAMGRWGTAIAPHYVKRAHEGDRVRKKGRRRECVRLDTKGYCFSGGSGVKRKPQRS